MTSSRPIVIQIQEVFFVRTSRSYYMLQIYKYTLLSIQRNFLCEETLSYGTGTKTVISAKPPHTTSASAK